MIILFKWLTAVNKKSCFIDCIWLKSYKSNYLETKNENSILRQNTYLLECLKYFNNRYEDIVYISKHNEVNIFITQSISVDYKGRISSICFYCYNSNASGKPQQIMRLFSDVRYNEECNVIDHIYIQDFIGTEINQGYGSLVMKQFIKYVKTLSVNKITGFLSFVDLGQSAEHKQLLYHFYEKFGFEINNNIITLNLNNTSKQLL